MKKKKETKTVRKNYVAFLLDETGSMMSRKAATISGFNEFLESMKAKLPVETFFSMTTFNSINRKPVYVNVPLKSVKKLTDDTYRPNAMTPLFDAIGNMVNDVKQAGTEGNKVLFVIMTDGQENASVEFSFEKVRKLIEEQKAQGWEFLFLGCDMDSYMKGFSAASQSLGVTKSVGVDPGNIKSAYAVTASYASNYFGSVDNSTWPDEKKK